MDNTIFQTASYTLPKMETISIPLDPERLEIVKKVLEQNQMILDFVLSPSLPNNLFLNVNALEHTDSADAIREELIKAMHG